MRARITQVWLGLACAVVFQVAGNAASLTDVDVRLMVRAIGFLQPRPADGGIVAIAYDAADPASKQDAEAIAGYFGDGLKAGNAMLAPRIEDVGQLAAGGFVAIITARGVNLGRVAAIGRALHVPCLTGDPAQIGTSLCVMAVRSKPTVEITVSRAAAASGEVTFAAAFLMMITPF
jgi:hypothetical protein